MILVIDNYDSFTYNLVQYLGELGAELKVYRNDKITISDMIIAKPKALVVSPGPGRPENAGVSCEAIKFFSGRIPVMGVCLGHQCIGYVHGAEIIEAQRLMHGKVSLIYHNGKTIFEGVDNPFEATRYHSLIIRSETMPKQLEVTAHTEENEIMGVKHKKYPLWGVQFHPESILTKEGKKILRNFFNFL
ncbi:MAG: anthranilate/aminodeoxychorismate synthase component II [Deltaproteobacteria bacterium CG1_02_45_11]|nr:MAG: anthranilate/aminodeoxychorismate synthase component II [Deltaproteobacteria bacterium CG1_02_45_11]